MYKCLCKLVLSLINIVLFVYPVAAEIQLKNMVMYDGYLESLNRSDDSSDIYINSLNLRNDLYVSNIYFLRINNTVGYGIGYYYLINPYSVNGQYRTYKFLYNFTLIPSARSYINRDNYFNNGVGIGYAYMSYKSIYRKQGIENVMLRYTEVNFPVYTEYVREFSDHEKFSASLTFSYGIYGKMVHAVGRETLSYHHSFRVKIMTSFTHKQMSLGPFYEYKNISRGWYGSSFTIGPGNYTNINSIGVNFSYEF